VGVVSMLSVRVRKPALITLATVATLWLVLLAPKLLIPMPSAASIRAVTDPVKRQQLIDERLVLQNDVRTTLLQGIGGAVLLLGVYLTFRQYQLSHEGQITDRFTHAVDQLGSDKLAVRVGGISALGRIARDSARDHEPVMETLSAFVREQSNELRSAGELAPTDMPKRLRGDLQAAATILGYRPENRRSEESRRINLRDSSLARVHLQKAHYEGIALTNADFRRGQLTGIYLTHALLRGARFGKAMLEEAHLTGAFLVGADLRYARLGEADFEGAWLFGANFEGTRLDYARLTGAYYETGLIVGWLREAMGTGPWKWGRLREFLDTPGGGALSIFLNRLHRHAGPPIDGEQIREGLRQVSFFLETQLGVSDEDEVPDLRIAKILAIRGISPDVPITFNDPDPTK
jgi:hypothetical protein